MIEPLRISFDVGCDMQHAFAVWTERASAWWPKQHTVSREQGLRIVFEPHVGGRIYERSHGGQEHDWGEITVWDPPHRLAYLSRIGCDAPQYRARLCRGMYRMRCGVRHWKE